MSNKNTSTSQPQVRWYDGQRVDQTDLITAQDFAVKTTASIIENHVGSGVLPNASIQAVLFDSDVLTTDQIALAAANNFDGSGIAPTTQPSDTTLGNQLEVELLDSPTYLNGPSTAFGRLCTKVLIVGLDFNSQIQYDALSFYKKEKQVTKKHYTKILSIFFNDFRGNNGCSSHLGGRVVIRESASLQLSRDCVMISQITQPNIYFRDFKTSGISIPANNTTALYQMLQDGIGSEYSVDGMNITTTAKQTLYLAKNDVTTKIGEKFEALTNNIQKITILLGASRNDATTVDKRYDWSGELIVSVYKLQTTVSSPTQLVPQLAIEFDPEPTPITQFSLDQSGLKDIGYVLTDVVQPVDFVFSSSILGNTNNTTVVPGQYYMITINRAGDASVGDLITATGYPQGTNSRLSTFAGGVWTDSSEDDLWFATYTDAGKLSDGQAYESGNGIEITKTITNDLGVVVDYSYGLNQFVNTGQNTINTAVLEAVLTPYQEQQDERTGNAVASRQQFKPTLSFVTNTTLTTLKETTNPLVVGSAKDANPKSTTVLQGYQTIPGLVKGDKYTFIAPDASLLVNSLIGSKIVPNNNCQGLDYRIFKATLCTDGYGDVNGDGIIDSTDLALAGTMLGESLLSPTTQQKIIDGYIEILQFLRADINGDGTIDASDLSLLSNYISRTIHSFPHGASFTHLELQVQQSIGRFDGYFNCNGYIRLDGGSNIVSPGDLTPSELIYDGYNVVPTMDTTDPIFSQIPFQPIAWKITPQPFWTDYQVVFDGTARLVPAVFTSFDSTTVTYQPGSCGSSSLVTSCADAAVTGLTTNAGKNDLFVPYDIILNGAMRNRDGSIYRSDLEIGIITLELPEIPITSRTLNVFQKLVYDYGDGFTIAGYPAMRFSDCTTVQVNALALNQLRFGVAIQSFVPNLNGLSPDGYGYGIIIDDILGVKIDQTTGILTISMKDIAYDDIHPELRTKIQITVYIKKSGWGNVPITIPDTQISGLLD